MRILQFVGYKNAGKTTLLTELVSRLAAEGRKVGTLKRDAHGFEPDVPGTDSRRHREAGASVTAIVSPARTAWFEEAPTALDRLVAAMSERGLDDLLIEGYKTAPYPKIALLRGDGDIGLLALPNLIAAVSRTPNERLSAAARTRSIPFFVHPDTRSFEPFIRWALAGRDPDSDSGHEPVER